MTRPGGISHACVDMQIHHEEVCLGIKPHAHVKREAWHQGGGNTGPSYKVLTFHALWCLPHQATSCLGHPKNKYRIVLSGIR